MRSSYREKIDGSQPDERDRLYLRLIARCGGVRVSHRKNQSDQFCLNNGAPVHFPPHWPFGASDFRRYLKRGWLTPDPHSTPLIPGESAQRYLAIWPIPANPRQPFDDELPAVLQREARRDADE